MDRRTGMAVGKVIGWTGGRTYRRTHPLADRREGLGKYSSILTLFPFSFFSLPFYFPCFFVLLFLLPLITFSLPAPRGGIKRGILPRSPFFCE